MAPETAATHPPALTERRSLPPSRDPVQGIPPGNTPREGPPLPPPDPPGGFEERVVATARLAYHHPGRVWTPPAVTRAFDWPFARAAAALSSLRELGYLAPVTCSVDFSGLAQYTVVST